MFKRRPPEVVPPASGDAFIPYMEGIGNLEVTAVRFYRRTWYHRWVAVRARKDETMVVAGATGEAGHDDRGDFLPMHVGRITVGDLMRGANARVYYRDVVSSRKVPLFAQ
ncbi:MAG TPA: hypothetical protein VMS08_00635 [Candidatus Saccharimonadia bacterium]|nr:hypothetical protein [Candidatus Saccharimonadia bacterium]